jgi:hypothetical protein
MFQGCVNSDNLHIYLALSEFTPQNMQNNLTESQKQPLVSTFKSLKTIDEQFNFWDKKLKHPYISFLFEISPYNDFAGTPIQDETFKSFKTSFIHPLKNQFRDYNLQLIKEYRRYYKKGSSIELIDLNDLKKDLVEFESSKNKDSLIQEYLRVIDSKITKQERLQQSSQGDLRSSCSDLPTVPTLQIVQIPPDSARYPKSPTCSA